MLDALRGYVERLLGPPPPTNAAAMGPSAPVFARYSTLQAMSAMSEHPWVRACVSAISTDLGAIPLVAVEDQGARLTELAGHPLLDRLASPYAGVTGVELQRQLWTDHCLAGVAYQFTPRPGSALYPGIWRLHPAQTQPVIDTWGQITAYRWTRRDGTETMIDPADMIVIRDPSWEASERMAVPSSPLEALHDGLRATRDARRHTAMAARRGRPEWLISPASADAPFGSRDGVERIRAEWEEQIRTGQGALVIGTALSALPLSLSAREMEFAALQEMVASEVLGVFHVPPVRVGLPGANYGTAKQQMRTYWEDLQGRHRLYTAQLTRYVASTAGRRQAVIGDFSGVESLQLSHTERLERTTIWVANGAAPREAAIYEGFHNPPIAEGAEPRALMPASAAEVDEPQGTRRSLAGDLEVYLEESRERYTWRARMGQAADAVADEVGRLAPVLMPHVGLAAIDLAAMVVRLVADEVVSHCAAAVESDTDPAVRSLEIWTTAETLAQLVRAQREAA